MLLSRTIDPLRHSTGPVMVNKTPLCLSNEVGTCPNFPKCRPFR